MTAKKKVQTASKSQAQIQVEEESQILEPNTEETQVSEFDAVFNFGLMDVTRKYSRSTRVFEDKLRIVYDESNNVTAKSGFYLSGEYIAEKGGFEMDEQVNLALSNHEK